MVPQLRLFSIHEVKPQPKNMQTKIIRPYKLSEMDRTLKTLVDLRFAWEMQCLSLNEEHA